MTPVPRFRLRRRRPTRVPDLPKGIMRKAAAVRTGVPALIATVAIDKVTCTQPCLKSSPSPPSTCVLFQVQPSLHSPATHLPLTTLVKAALDEEALNQDG